MKRINLSVTTIVLALVLASWPAQAMKIIEAALVQCYPEAGTCEIRQPACPACKVMRLKLSGETKIMKNEKLESLPEIVVGVADVAYREQDEIILWFQMLDVGK